MNRTGLAGLAQRRWRAAQSSQRPEGEGDTEQSSGFPRPAELSAPFTQAQTDANVSENTAQSSADGGGLLGLNSTLFPAQSPPSDGKGSARIFSRWLVGGGDRQSLRVQGRGLHTFNGLGRTSRRVQRLGDATPRIRQRPQRNSNWCSGKARPRGPGSFQAGLVSRCRQHQKGELRSYRSKVGSHFCRKAE